MPDQPTAPPFALAAIRHWAYQIEALDAAGAVQALADSSYDLLVLEPTRTDWSSDARGFDTPGMVERLKATAGRDGTHRKLLLAYVDIGEAEDWRWYWTWSQEWVEGQPMPGGWPAFIITRDPDGWTGNYPVAYWDPDWKDIVIYGREHSSEPYGDYTSVIDEVLRSGFDGIYLDWVEAFENEEVMTAAGALGLDPAEEMIAFIREMRTYARHRDPDFLIVQQNAAALSEGHPELLDVIDAIAQEAVWYDGEATDDWSNPDGHDQVNDGNLTSYYTQYLDQYLGAGVPVFDCEYAVEHAADAYAQSAERGYVPYCTRRSLAELTTTPPPGYSRP